MKNEEVGKWMIALGVVASLVVVIIILVRINSNSSENFRVWPGGWRGGWRRWNWGTPGWRRRIVWGSPGWGWNQPVNYNPTYVVGSDDFKHCYNNCIMEDCAGCGNNTNCTLCHGKCAQKCQNES